MSRSTRSDTCVDHAGCRFGAGDAPASTIMRSIIERTSNFEDKLKLQLSRKKQQNALHRCVQRSAAFESIVARSLTNQLASTQSASAPAPVGPGRLPMLSNRPALPCMDVIVKEALRWHVSVPLALPHDLTSEDDGYTDITSPRILKS